MKRPPLELYVYSPLDGQPVGHRLYLLVRGTPSTDQFGFVSVTTYDRLGVAEGVAREVAKNLGVTIRRSGETS